MKLILTKKPKNVTIIEGFPGFGLIGTIVIEFFMEHLKTEKIGVIEMDEIPAMVAIHQSKVIEPVSIHYNKEFNMVFLHALNIGKDLGWKLANVVMELVEQLSAKEIISLEGVGSPHPDQGRVFYYSNGISSSVAELNKIAKPLMEGIVVGVTGALLTKDLKMSLIAFFAEAESNMPDSKAAAEIIKAVDAYTGLNVDPKPLLKQAALFQEKLKSITGKTQKAKDIQEKKALSYVG